MKSKLNWKIKAQIFFALSKIPAGNKIHFLMQRYVTKEWPRKPETLEQLFIAAQQVFKEAYFRVNPQHSQFIEIGAGRDLAVATALCFLGVKKVICIDIVRLARPDLIAHAAQFMAMKLGKSCPKLETWEDIKDFGISYIAPFDLLSLKLPSESTDCFYSIDTLEHIPRLDLERIFFEVRRIIKPSGLIINLIDYSDHFARGGDISRFNFLKFSDGEWQRFNSKFQYVNRMRHSEFLELFRKVGFQPLSVEADVESSEVEIVENLAAEFKNFSNKDLFTIRAKIVATRAI